MVITNKHLQELLQKEFGNEYEAKKFHEDEHYKWFIIYFIGSPVFVIRYHKSAKYFCNIVSLISGVNPIDASYVTKASEKLDDELNENQSK